MPLIIPNLFDFVSGRQAALNTQTTLQQNRGLQLQNFQSFLNLTRDRLSFGDEIEGRGRFALARQQGLSPAQANLSVFQNSNNAAAGNAALTNLAAQLQLGTGPALAFSNTGDNSLAQSLFPNIPNTGRLSAEQFIPAFGGQAAVDQFQGARAQGLINQLQTPQNLANALGESQAAAAQANEQRARTTAQQEQTTLQQQLDQIDQRLQSIVPQIDATIAPNQFSTGSAQPQSNAGDFVRRSTPLQVSLQPTTQPAQSGVFRAQANSLISQTNTPLSQNPQNRTNPFGALANVSPFGPSFFA